MWAGAGAGVVWAWHAQHLETNVALSVHQQSNAIHFSYLQGARMKKLKSEADGGSDQRVKNEGNGQRAAGGRGKSCVRVAK